MALKKTGEKEVLANLNKFIRSRQGLTRAGLNDAALLIIQEAVPITPKDEGLLRKKFYKKHLIFKGSPAIEIGNDAEYAAVQHENLEFKHTVGEAKFLEKALVRNVGRIKDIIVRRLKV